MTRQVDVKALISHIVRGDGADKCRICMGDTSEGQVYLGDTVMMDGDRAVTLSELLEVITGVEVPMEGDLPSGLCLKCFEPVKAAVTFRAFCLQAIEQWHNTVALLEGLPDMEDVDQNKSIYAFLQNNTITTMTMEKKVDIKKDVTMHVENKAAIKKDSGKVKMRAVRNKVTKCQCPDCGSKFKYPKDLHRHLLQSTENKQACFICASIVPRELLANHLKKIHKKEFFACKKCPVLLSSEKELNRHVLKHGSGSHPCVDCGLSFKSAMAYYSHISSHDIRNCPNCDELFRNRKCYLFHVKKCWDLDVDKNVRHVTKSRILYEINRDDKKLKVGIRGSSSRECYCDYCGKKFAGKKFVSAHIQIVHTKDTHTPCPYCGKSYAAAHMTEHIKKHEEVSSFTCGHCGIKLRTRLGYVQHIRLHTGEKPYKCKYCSETFSGSSRRSDHVRRFHRPGTIILKYGCEYCPAKFKLPYQLKQHVESVHIGQEENKKNFECPDCLIKFNSCRGMLHHRRKHHSSKHVLTEEKDNE